MQQQISLRLLPHEANDNAVIKKYITSSLAINENRVTGFYLTRYSLDARSKQSWIELTLLAFIDEPAHERPQKEIILQDVTHAKKSAVIIGAGPAGLFAALKFIEQNIQPIILERGKDVRSRRRDLALLNKEGIINTESNYCFGEGGAGTYSDGKLYTRSTKRGDVNRILQILVQFGADEKILYESHPHIGTNKLPQIITAMRQAIVNCGGKFLFEKKVTDFVIEHNEIKSVRTADGAEFFADDFILATGHSARDIFTLLHHKHIAIEAKPFALGIRIEHPQCLIDAAQYHLNASFLKNSNKNIRPEELPPASYSLKEQINGRGVFSFCMCPGGIIAPAATNEEEIVVNGWSPSKRNNPYSNSG
ncbi:MAG TPA: FAD-binding protein, partial [Chitinophagaceae bacterium]|nr:FAD-binding protein [Chitinophagaceae bacterium]